MEELVSVAVEVVNGRTAHRATIAATDVKVQEETLTHDLSEESHTHWPDTERCRICPPSTKDSTLS